MVHLVSLIITAFLLQAVFPYLTNGFLLPDDIELQSHLPKLPQFNPFGKSLVLVGGNFWDNNTEIYGKIIDLAGGKGVAKIGIINAANADPLGSFNFYRALFLQHGALEANRIPIDLNNTADQANQTVIDQIYNQTGFFFGGGDQARVIQSFLGPYGEVTPALIALHQMFDIGAVISGTSAGCTCQTAQYMIEGGLSYDALLFGTYADNYTSVPSTASPDLYLSFGGLGFLKGYVLDSHFTQRGREGRMIRMLSDTRSKPKGSEFGIGVDENTGLVVTDADTDNAMGQVIGSNGVTIFDLSHARVHKQSKHFNISGVYISYLTHGDVIQLSNQNITFSSAKIPLWGNEAYDNVLTSDDVFYGSTENSGRKPEFVRIATSVFDARNGRTTDGTTFKMNPRFKVELSAQGHDAEGYVERKHSFHTDVTSYKNMHVAIAEG